MLLEKSSFSQGTGSIIYSNQIGNLLEDSTTEFIEKIFNNSNIESKNISKGRALVIVRDCSFIQIRHGNFDDYGNGLFLNNNLIRLSYQNTFYMTSCLIDSCFLNNSILYLESRATTISHICCNSLDGAKNPYPLFLYSAQPRDTFSKFIYSTIYGTNTDTLARGIILLTGLGALRYQCINTSNFVLPDHDQMALRIEAASCLTMLMNSFYKLDAQIIFFLNVHDGGFEKYTHLCGMSNFCSIQQRDAFFYLDMLSITSFLIDECYFSDIENSERGIVFRGINGNAEICISNCVFESFLNTQELNRYETINCQENVSNFQTLTLAHYTVVDKCDALHVTEAFGCQNSTCPDNNGCETFGFNPNDVFYTEKFHPDIDTPTPTPSGAFTKTLDFTVSSEFTETGRFSRSIAFSQSNSFKPTLNFDRTNSFTPSNTFTRSNSFTKSNNFTKTDIFSNSNKFSNTEKFSNSLKFSNSNRFTNSLKFSNSNRFTNSLKFSNSNRFTNSLKFSNTNRFTNSLKFSNSNRFSNSLKFSNTNRFTNSLKFSNSNIFSNSLKFSNTNRFTNSLKFSESDLFKNSNIFSMSNSFTKTNQFTCSQHFSQSSRFTRSQTFSPTPTQSDKNNMKTYSIIISQTMTIVKTVTFSQSYSEKASYYECMNDNGMISSCLTKTNSFYMFPYIIFSLSQSPVFSLYEEEIKFRKTMSKEVFIGVVCGSVSALFSVIGIIVLFKNRGRMIEISDIFGDSSEDDNQETLQTTEVQIDTNTMKNDLDDDWL
ncbi:hypothetical protein M9Y10_045334 [Tritrichomonas musculus]|uniref:Right handed beta helix domain-containing protein n=1 Tax=Tritrichomonas musculus TaxID=1915356 RepID=A0ABR2JWT5_9EUKA